MKNISFKVAGIFASIAFVVAAVPASAMTTAQLVSLLQGLGVSADVIAAVTAAQGGSTGTTTSCPSFARDLTVGSTGADVVDLQTFLESKGYLVIPAGTSKGYFGTLTQQAVAKMQTANAISPAAGYFGPMTRAKVAQLCTPATPGTPGTPGTPATPGLSGGDGDIQNVKKITSGTETTVGEGTEENVLGFEIEADDNSDLEITSVRVIATATGTGSTRLNRYVDEVIIYQGDDEVGSLDASDFSRDGKKHTATISLKGAVVDAGEKERFYVAFVALDSIDSNDIDTMNFEVEVDRIRYTDASGSSLSETPNPVITELVDFEDSSENDDVRLQSSNDDPDARTIVVEETSTSDEEVVFAFKLKAGSKSSDVNILSIPVEFTITNGASSTSAEKIFNDLWLEVDGQTYDDYTMAGSATTIDGSTTTTRTAVFTIDEGDLVVEGGDSVDVLVYAKFGKQKDNYSSGTKISGKVTAEGIDAENEQGDEVGIKGTAVTGEDQTLLSTGINAEYVSQSFTAEKPADLLEGTISVTFKVTAVGDEFSIDEEGANIDYTLTGATETDEVVSVKGKTAKSGNFILSDGSTQEMTLSVKFASTTGFVKLVVNSIDGYTVSNIESLNN
jgi:hypothetical protein